MALQSLPLEFLLALASLLSAHGQEENFNTQTLPQGTGKKWFFLLEASSFSRGKPVYKEVWIGRNSRGVWDRIWSSVECSEVLQVDPETFEISSTSIKLKWTCRFPDACQGMRAMCRLAVPSSPPCEAEEVKGEQMLHGQEGTFTCSPLQPFTEYRVSIDLPPNTTLFSWLFTTEQTVPDKPEQLWLDPDRGSLRWNSLSSCKGEIIGYQVPRGQGRPSARAWSSVQAHWEGWKGTAGMTSAPVSFAARLSREPGHPRPCSQPALPEAAPAPGPALPVPTAREHQLLVAPTHNSSVIEGMCSGQPQLLNASVYVAAVLNLSASTDFVLGDGSRGQGEHNAALRPGCGYTALLRLARRSPQVRPGCCSCSPGMLPAGAAPLLPLGCLSGHPALPCLGRLLFLLRTPLCFSRKRKYLPNRSKEDNEKGRKMQFCRQPSQRGL
uniref:Fibronectin type-III domain-containing protein n=1 Tax=Ficedula albicollis TaxID=59894 RepID=A0A803V9T1_FICAL